MPVGNWTWFDKAIDKFANRQFNLTGDTFKLALTTSTQAISKTFLGTSTDCRYADLTAELATANGYTVGGLSLTSLSLLRSGSTETWSAGNASWTITGAGVTFKYGIVYDDTNANKDLLCFVDSDTGGGSTTVLAAGSPLAFSLASGILRMIGP